MARKCARDLKKKYTSKRGFCELLTFLLKRLIFATHLCYIKKSANFKAAAGARGQFSQQPAEDLR